MSKNVKADANNANKGTSGKNPIYSENQNNRSVQLNVNKGSKKK